MQRWFVDERREWTVDVCTVQCRYVLVDGWQSVLHVLSGWHIEPEHRCIRRVVLLAVQRRQLLAVRWFVQLSAVFSGSVDERREWVDVVHVVRCRNVQRDGRCRQLHVVWCGYVLCSGWRYEFVDVHGVRSWNGERDRRRDKRVDVHDLSGGHVCGCRFCELHKLCAW